MQQQDHYPQFFTATCLEWQYLLQENTYKDIVLQDLRWLVAHHWIKLYPVAPMSQLSTTIPLLFYTNQ